MPFVVRAIISLLAGVGAGLIGFWTMWQAVWTLVGEHPGLGHGAWLVGGIFAPGIRDACGACLAAPLEFGSVQ